MGTEIKTWQIVDGKLSPVSTNLKNEGKTEPYDLEPWIASHPAIIGTDIAVIGRQVMSKSGSIDLLGIDKSGNLVIIEIKRDKLPREALAQAIDYASDAAEWAIEKIGEICTAYTGKGLVDDRLIFAQGPGFQVISPEFVDHADPTPVRSSRCRRIIPVLTATRADHQTEGSGLQQEPTKAGAKSGISAPGEAWRRRKRCRSRRRDR